MATRKKATKRSGGAATRPPAKKAGSATKAAPKRIRATAGIHVPDTGKPYDIRFDPAHRPNTTLSIKGVVAEGAAEPPERNVTDAASTAVYVHGIGNHPEEQVLVVRWDRALFGKDMGDRSRMAYWVNRARYPQPSNCDCIDPRCACHDPEEAVRARKVLAVGDPDPERELQVAVRAITDDEDERQFLYDIGARMLDEAKAEVGREQAQLVKEGAAGRKGIYSVSSKGIGDALLRKLTDLITSVALPDVQDFLFDPEHRKQMDDVFLARLRSGGGPFVVIAHSQGSMIAYDVLRQLPADVEVKLFVTIGSPLGLPPVRAVFKKWTGKDRLPFPPCVKRWVNVATEGDVVALDPTLGDEIERPPGDRFKDYPRITRQARDENPLFEGNPHSSMGYLSTKEVQNEVYEAVGREFARSLGRQVITSDLVEKMESAPDDKRHPVLIEVREDKKKGESSIAEGRQHIDSRLRMLAQRIGGDVSRMRIQHHMRYVSAALSRTEIEVLRTESDDLQVMRVWQNAQKKALICRSAHILHAAPAHQAYAAHGNTIEWAVLDTGMEHTHPHFARHRNIASLWDCTRNNPSTSTAISEPLGGFVDYRTGSPQWPAGAEAPEFRDGSGHGTHVAGIIAGAYPHRLTEDDELLDFAGMAPCAKLHSFKVLDNRGRGEDAWILIALDKIARINENAQELRIHGINLSLGGNFDPSVYGCGHTPLCQELRRLWRQGVLIVMAAGNEGFTVLQTLEDGPWQANLDLSIGDPANLEEAIAVGSVHRVNPHTFGVSYFSSRGPTADGRRKPDVVAPGEKILSARADYDRMLPQGAGKAPFTDQQLQQFTAEQLYIAESGTSMAAPHVSGLLAAFLSQRREFIGYPDRVKRILMDNCTDLERDPYAQGAGLPNLMRMLQST